MQYSSRISACRRELNSHEAAKPQTANNAHRLARRGMSVECGREEPGNFSTAGWSKRGDFKMNRRNNTMRNQDMEPWHHLVTPCRSGSSGFQSVCRAAAVSIGAFFLGQLARQLEYVVRHGLQRGAGSLCGSPSRDSKITPLTNRRASMPNPLKGLPLLGKLYLYSSSMASVLICV